MSNIDELKITDIAVINFYKKHKLDVNIINKLIINMLNEILKEGKSNMSEMITKSILENINTLKEEMKEIRENILKMNTENINKLYEMKQTYIEEIRIIINNNESSNILKLTGILEKENNIMLNKTEKILNEIIPKNNNEINKIIKNYKEEMKDMSNIMTKEDLIKMMEMKYEKLIENIKVPLEKSINEMNINEIKSQLNQEKINTKINDYIDKFNNSTDKGLLSENKLNYILQNLYTEGEIINTSKDYHKCDFLLKRNNKKDILIENKDYKDNVPKTEIIKFLSDLTNYNSTNYDNANGILISQNSGIANKKNFQIDIDNNNIILYIHKCEYDKDIIKCGVDIIDHLTIILKDLNNKTNNTISISTETLNEINNEYLAFINRRQTLKNYINDSNKKIIDQLMEMEMPNLSHILKSRYSTIIVNDLTCEKCKKFIGRNKKALSVHYRSCKKQINDSLTPTSSEKE